MLFDAHWHGFRVFGGVPRRGIYDNMKTAVDRVGKGKTRQVNARFLSMAGHYVFEPEFCNPAAGWEKGQVEKNVQDARHRILQLMPSPIGLGPVAARASLRDSPVRRDISRIESWSLNARRRITLGIAMSITPLTPDDQVGGEFKHGSVLSGNFRAARVSSQRKSTAWFQIEGR